MKPLLAKKLCLLWIALFLCACSASGPTAAPGQASPTALPSSTVAPTSLPTSTPTPTSLPSSTPSSTVLIAHTLTPTSPPPSPTLPAPTQTTDPNAKVVIFNHISLAIPRQLGQAVAVKIVPAVPLNQGKPWLAAPKHDLITLSGYPAPKNSYLIAEILVYPLQGYININSGALANLRRLQAILANPTAPLTNDVLPWLPFTPGEQSIAAQAKPIPFKDGSGVRFLTQYDTFLDPVVTAPGDPIVNRLLFYHFEGLSLDGKSYIIAILPLANAFLADNPDPTAQVPTGGVPYPPLGTDVNHAIYFNAVTNMLNAASADSFQPSLDELDSLIGSFDVSPQ